MRAVVQRDGASQDGVLDRPSARQQLGFNPPFNPPTVRKRRARLLALPCPTVNALTTAVARSHSAGLSCGLVGWLHFELPGLRVLGPSGRHLGRSGQCFGTRSECTPPPTALEPSAQLASFTPALTAQPMPLARRYDAFIASYGRGGRRRRRRRPRRYRGLALSAGGTAHGQRRAATRASRRSRSKAVPGGGRLPLSVCTCAAAPCGFVSPAAGAGSAGG